MTKPELALVVATGLALVLIHGDAAGAGQTGFKGAEPTSAAEYWITGLGNRGRGHALEHSYRVLAGGCVQRGHGRNYCGSGTESRHNGRVTPYGRTYQATAPAGCVTKSTQIPVYKSGQISHYDTVTWVDCPR